MIVRRPAQLESVSATAIVYVPTEAIVNSTSDASLTRVTGTGEPSASDTVQLHSKAVGETGPVTSPPTRTTDVGPAVRFSKVVGEIGRMLTWHWGKPAVPAAPVVPAVPVPLEPAKPGIADAVVAARAARPEAEARDEAERSRDALHR